MRIELRAVSQFTSNSSNSKARILKFFEKFDHPVSHVFITCFSSVMVSLLCWSRGRTIHWLNKDKLLEYGVLIQLVTGIATKQWLSRNLLPYIKDAKMDDRICQFRKFIIFNECSENKYGPWLKVYHTQNYMKVITKIRSICHT